MIRRALLTCSLVLSCLPLLGPATALSQPNAGAAAWQSLSKLPPSERRAVLEREGVRP